MSNVSNENPSTIADAGLEKSFQSITAVIFGKSLTGFRDYEKWAMENVSTNEYGKSIMSGEKIYLPPFDFYRDIKHNILTIEEGYDIQGKKQLSSAELDSLTFANAKSKLQKISTVTPNTEYGENSNMTDCDFYYSSHNSYNCVALVRSKACFYSFWPRQSSYTIGCYYTFSSQFCIKCYNSENLTRCFEMSDCTNCSDSMFCHNCENVQDSMFCFNAKNLRNAIGNVPLPLEKYKEIKRAVLTSITSSLEKTHQLDWNIFNLGKWSKASGDRKAF